MFELPPLPYPKDALAPHMSAETLDFHHGKHHKAYVDKLNGFVEGTELESKTLEEVILAVSGKDDATQKKIFNNAAQTWNHTFFWHSMTPGGGGKPSGKIAEMIDRDLGGFDAFAKGFADQGVNHFGSGWAWLVFDNDRLDIITTHDADLPLAHGKIALTTCDLWEHAYYIDYRNKRPDFIAAFLDHLIDWNQVAERLEKAQTLKAEA